MRALDQMDFRVVPLAPKPRMLYKSGIRTDILRELGKLVDMFTSVPAAGDAEAEIKVKVFQQALPEVVPFDHPEV